MFHLPICPYCHAVYRYSEVKNLKVKQCECYHCKKNFSVNRRLRSLPVIIVSVLLIIIDLFLLHTSKDINLLPMAGVNALVIFLSFLMTPFAVRFLPMEEKRPDYRKNKTKNKQKPKKAKKTGK